MAEVITDQDLLNFQAKLEGPYIIPASACRDDVISRLNGEGSISGDLLPWSKTHNCVRLRPGEVSLWGAYNGHGKSQILNQVCAWNLFEKRWLIASMEMLPDATMTRMVRQVSGTNIPSDEYVDRFLSWTDGRLWLYDQTDTVQSDRIVAMIHYAAQELGIHHIVVDSLMKCGLGRNDTHSTSNAQATFVDAMCRAAKNYRVHIHLVHHMRKGQNEYEEPDKLDFRGAAEVTDLADNVFILHRNKRKEDKGIDDPDEPDATLRVAKQRGGEWEGKFKLWFHKQSMQYLGESGRGPLPFQLRR